MVLSACGGKSTSTNDGSATEGTGSGSASTTLTVAAATDIESFDPHNNNNTSSEAVLVNVFDYLIKNDSEQKKLRDLRHHGIKSMIQRGDLRRVKVLPSTMAIHSLQQM